jgi:adenylate kinase
MGLPGSGKGTQGKMLADVNGIHLLSMGELVRMYVTGERRRQMLAGALLNDDEIIAMLDRVLRTMEDDDDCILDGFPRTIKQAEWLMEQVKQGRFEVSKVIYLDISNEAVLQRLKARGSLDDTEEVIAARLTEYERLTQPVVQWLEERGVEIVRVDGERSTDVVHRDIVSKLHLS